MRERLDVAIVEEKLMQYRLRWFGHIQRRPTEATIHNEVMRRTGNGFVETNFGGKMF
jgi:hypothetical protein